MNTRNQNDHLNPSRRNFIKGGAIAGGIIINLSWPSILAAQTTEGKTSMLFHLDFHVEYSAEMTQNDLFAIWAEEAGAALGAKEAGLVVDLWKAVGERRVIVIVNVESVEVLDQILLDLPIMQKMGQHVQVDVTALRTYEGFAADVKERVGR
ncbi:MAG: muconolactone Delta-isomerase family protein [Tateyamaria sp.]|uniref:muconolactone Delta-isomerase n=1 Tax=Tateyamaria sp. TaxID=1929288 RepID=UPI003286AA57